MEPPGTKDGPVPRQPPMTPVRRFASLLTAIVVLALMVIGLRTTGPAPRSKLRYHGTRSASPIPPTGAASQAPQFIALGFDDVRYSGLAGSGGTGGVKFVLDLFNSRRNPPGSGNAATFDGAQVTVTLFSITRFIEAGSEAPHLRALLRQAARAGNELAIHTYSHPLTVEIDRRKSPATRRDRWTLEDWQPELGRSQEILEKLDGVGSSAVEGFRAPYLVYNDVLFEALRGAALRYDSSIEEGWQTDQDGTNFLWPYTLDSGSPGDSFTATTYYGVGAIVGAHRGFWELPVYTVVVPPDELCEQYGIPVGLRARLKRADATFHHQSGKTTGVDYNLWVLQQMTKAEFLGTLKHTLDLRLKGNRCPLIVALHTDLYSDKYEANDLAPGQALRSTVKERQEALAEFLDFALSKPDVRMTSMKSLLDWLVAGGPPLAKKPHSAPGLMSSPAGVSRAPSEQGAEAAIHRGILATIFWAGEPAGPDNGNIPNHQSAWDESWQEHFGGLDDPAKRDGFSPAGFVPKENPFYVALPYNDIDSGVRRADALRIVPWANAKTWADDESMCKDQWVAIDAHGKTAYAQWEDVGPFETGDAAYVFGTAAPSNRRGCAAGIDVSPAVRDFLGLSGAEIVDWHFVPAGQVPEGPWRKTVTRGRAAQP